MILKFDFHYGRIKIDISNIGLVLSKYFMIYAVPDNFVVTFNCTM